MYSIEVNNLTKKFGKFVSVDSISFNVNEGEVFGFLGANGAGKSTTIRMLCGIIEPTSGDALVGGFSIKKQSEKVKRNIGYMSQKFSLYNDLTVSENINFFGSIYGLKNSELEERKKWVLQIANIEDKENIITGSLAVGFKQRLALGCAVLHNPKIVFLDEPTGGVDPVSRRNFWDLINSLSSSGVTVFVTTHYLDEAEFCNRIMMINAGKLIAGGSPDELKKKYLSNVILEIECSNIENAILILDKMECVKNSAYYGNNIHATLAGFDKNDVNIKNNLLEKIKSELTSQSIDVTRITEIYPSLEDVFVNLLENTKAEND
jgi:ABC-2 type transport system ATP-binding protein